MRFGKTLALALLGTAFTLPAQAGATREAIGSFQLYDLELEDPSTGWWQSVEDNYLFLNPYVRTVGHHGSSIGSRARKGAKERAANAAIVCMAAFYVNGKDSQSWKTNCQNSSVLEILDPAENFQALVRDRICPDLKALAKAAGAGEGGVTFSASVRLFADTGGSEGDFGDNIGEVRGQCL